MDEQLESQIAQWRSFVERRQAVVAADADEMEDHLRDQIGDLVTSGLSSDEAFLVAVKRMGNLDEISREFAREHSDRLWKQLVLTGPADPDAGSRGLGAALALACGAAVSVRLALWLVDRDATIVRNLPLIVLLFVAGLFAWRRRSVIAAIVSAATFAAGGLILNLYPLAHPFDEMSPTENLTATHLPIVLWLAVGFAYVGAQWRSHARRMDFLRFTGEWVVYFALLGLGGMVLVGLTSGMLESFGINSATPMGQWVVPMGAAGAAVVAAWLVEAKQSVIENIAPVLTGVFTPLTVIMLGVMLGVLVTRRDFLDVQRHLLIIMDLMLVVVVGLVLYAISARDPDRPPGWFDRLQYVLMVVAFATDALLLATMVARIADAGVTASKVAALGLNLVLLVNLVWSARLNARFVRGAAPFAALERWQTSYLPVYGAWAAFVVVALPPIFGFA